MSCLCFDMRLDTVKPHFAVQGHSCHLGGASLQHRLGEAPFFTEVNRGLSQPKAEAHPSILWENDHSEHFPILFCPTVFSYHSHHTNNLGSRSNLSLSHPETVIRSAEEIPRDVLHVVAKSHPDDGGIYFLTAVVDETYPSCWEQYSPKHRAKEITNNTQSRGDGEVKGTGHGVIETWTDMLQDASTEEGEHCVLVCRTVPTDHQLHDESNYKENHKTVRNAVVIYTTLLSMTLKENYLYFFYLVSFFVI